MALPKSKDFPVAGDVEPKALLIGAALVAWTVNWGLFKATGTPWLYCGTQSALGPILSEWHDGLRAILFAAVIVGLFTLKLRWVATLTGVMVLNLMIPGIVATLFSFGHSCKPPAPPIIAVAEKAPPSSPSVYAKPGARPAPKPKTKPKNCPNPYSALPNPPEPEGCPVWVGPRSVW